jgi:iron(III) transport system ATP-binding protein
MDLLQVKHVTKKGEGDFVLSDINFSLNRFKKLVIAGETGSGKSTLLKIVAGLIQPDSGEVFFEGEKVRGPDETLVSGHPRIAYLSQHFELAKFLRVEQVLDYANKFSDEEFNALVQICQIDHLLKRTTDKISGGEKQRIALCRLLIGSPKLLLLDEPFSHLDLAHKNVLKTVIHNICTKLKITCILVSHDPHDTLSWADKIIVLKDGKMVQQGTAEKIYAEPTTEYVAGLFGEYNLIPRTVLKRKNLKSKTFGDLILVRPEHFQITSRDKALFKVKVDNVIFYGNFYHATASLDGTSILIRIQAAVVPGKTLFLKLK